MTEFIDSTERLVIGTTRVLQFITLAMLTGLVAFLVFVLTKHQFQFQRVPFNQSPLTLATIVMFSSTLPMTFVIPFLIVKAMLKVTANGQLKLEPGTTLQGADRVLEALLRICKGTRIVRLALLEAPGFFAGVAYLLTQDSIALGLACCSVLLIASQFPTQFGIQQWLDSRSDELAELVEQGRTGQS